MKAMKIEAAFSLGYADALNEVPSIEALNSVS